MDSGTALQALNSFQPTSSADLLTTAQNKYGVNDLSSRVQALNGVTSNLTNSIAAVDPSVTGRTSGSLVTEAQRSALVSRERQPLIEDLSKNNSDLNAAQGALTSAHSLAAQMAAALASDQLQKYNTLKDKYTMAKDAENQQAATATEQAKEAEAQREFNVNSGQEQQKINLSSQPKAYTPSEQVAANTLATSQAQQANASKIGSYLSSNAGKDHYVSPSTYAAAKQAWGADGYDTTMFDKLFAGFRNPNQPSWAAYG